MRPFERFEIDSCTLDFLGMKRTGFKNRQDYVSSIRGAWVVPHYARLTRAFLGRTLPEHNRPYFFCGSNIFSPFLNTP